jgi:hypothetical protein
MLLKREGCSNCSSGVGRTEISLSAELKSVRIEAAPVSGPDRHNTTSGWLRDRYLPDLLSVFVSTLP